MSECKSPSSSWGYNKITKLPADVKQADSSTSINGNGNTNPWVFTNKLFEPIYLYVIPISFSFNQTRFDYIGILGSNETKSYTYDKFRAGDYVLTCIKSKGKDNKINYIRATAPMILNESRKFVDFGVIAYDSYGDTNITTVGISNDIPSFRIINRLTVPVDIFYTNEYDYRYKPILARVATIDADDGLDYMGGSSSNIFMSNGSQGFKFGQTLVIKVRNTDITLAHYKLVDNYLKNLYLGATVANNVNPELTKQLVMNQYFSSSDALVSDPSHTLSNKTLGSIPNDGYSLPLNDRVMYSTDSTLFHDVVFYKPMKNCRTSRYASNQYRSAKIGGLV